MKIYCKYCEYEIERTHLCYRVDDGYVHEDCLNDYMDEKWEELSDREKRDLMGISNEIHMGAEE